MTRLHDYMTRFEGSIDPEYVILFHPRDRDRVPDHRWVILNDYEDLAPAPMTIAEQQRRWNIPYVEFEQILARPNHDYTPAEIAEVRKRQASRDPAHRFRPPVATPFIPANPIATYALMLQRHEQACLRIVRGAIKRFRNRVDDMIAAHAREFATEYEMMLDEFARVRIRVSTSDAPASVDVPREHLRVDDTTVLTLPDTCTYYDVAVLLTGATRLPPALCDDLIPLVRNVSAPYHRALIMLKHGICIHRNGVQIPWIKRMRYGTPKPRSVPAALMAQMVPHMRDEFYGHPNAVIIPVTRGHPRRVQLGHGRPVLINKYIAGRI